ncbi:hypothetical protein E4U19_003897 [Claviceps sp. Clav32 group G5]|nr:hypothetical protein E4U19_003897 [Claviceps sp. Clav32 group G5]
MHDARALIGYGPVSHSHLVFLTPLPSVLQLYSWVKRLKKVTQPSSDSVEIILDNSRGTPISEDHDDDTSAAIDEPLDSGDLDKQDAYDEAIGALDLTQVDDEEEPDLPPLPPKSPPPLDRKEYPSTYHRLMDIMDDHGQKRRRTT